MLATVPCVRLLSVGNYLKALLLTSQYQHLLYNKTRLNNIKLGIYQMKQNYELIARKVILMTLKYIDSKDSILKQNILSLLKDLSKEMNATIRESNKFKGQDIKKALYEFIDPNNGYGQTINKLYNIIRLD